MAAPDPSRLYSFSEARQFIRSPSGGTVCLRTLRNWQKAGRFQGVPRRSGKRVYWFVWGAELIRILGAEASPGPAFEADDEAERKEAIDRALREARALGYKI